MRFLIIVDFLFIIIMIERWKTEVISAKMTMKFSRKINQSIAVIWYSLHELTVILDIFLMAKLGTATESPTSS